MNHISSIYANKTVVAIRNEKINYLENHVVFICKTKHVK